MPLRIANWDKHFENANSRKLKRLDWVAIPNKMDGAGYTTLVDHPNGAAHLGAWLAIVEIASRQGKSADERGIIPDGVGGICRCLGRISRLPGGIFEEAIPRLIEIGWLEEVQSNQQTANVLGESANVVAESADEVGRSADEVAAHYITGNYTTGKEIQNKLAPTSSARVSKLRALGWEEPTWRWVTKAPDDVCVRIVEARGLHLEPSDDLDSEFMIMTRLCWFENFWREYWLHKSKKAARIAYLRKVFTDELSFEILTAVERQAPEMLAREEKNRPHAATWINGDRWNDETAGAADPSESNGLFA